MAAYFLIKIKCVTNTIFSNKITCVHNNSYNIPNYSIKKKNKAVFNYTRFSNFSLEFNQAAR